MSKAAKRGLELYRKGSRSGGERLVLSAQNFGTVGNRRKRK